MHRVNWVSRYLCAIRDTLKWIDGRGAGGRGNVANLDITEITAVDNISVFILPSIVNNVRQIGSRDRLGLHSVQSRMTLQMSTVYDRY